MVCFLIDNIPKIEYLMLIKDTHTKKAPSNKTPACTKICFRIKSLKAFKISSDCQKKHANLLNGGLF